MPKRILTFEVSQTGHEIEVHGNEDGLRKLCDVVQRLLKTPGNEHEHLFTPAWGGHDLSETQNGDDTDKLVNKVTIYLWRSDEKPSG